MWTLLPRATLRLQPPYAPNVCSVGVLSQTFSRDPPITIANESHSWYAITYRERDCTSSAAIRLAHSMLSPHKTRDLPPSARVSVRSVPSHRRRRKSDSPQAGPRMASPPCVLLLPLRKSLTSSLDRAKMAKDPSLTNCPRV